MHIKRKPLIGIVLLAVAGFVVWGTTRSKTTAIQYQTAQVEKGTLIKTVSASGNVTTGSNLAIVTNASGTVSRVYVKNGDTVKLGQKIADITLDQNASQKQAAAWASYLSAKNSLASSQNQLNTLQAQAFAANQTFIKGAIADNDSTSDPVYIQQNANWLAAEGAYINQAKVIQQAQANVSSAWLNYQQVAPTITAPSQGVVANLLIAPGYVISVSSSSSTGSSTPSQLGTITQPNQNTQANVNLAEIDVAKVQVGQKVTMKLDAFPESTFTGKILTINTNGVVSSGVTNYPATIVFDTAQSNIYPNMAVTASIMTKVEDNVVLIPTASVQTTNGSSTVRRMVGGKVTNIPVELGDSNDTQIVVTSGLQVGDEIITGQTGGEASVVNSSTNSVFGGGNRGGGFGGSTGAVRVIRGN